jgi:O-antigen ligase
MSTYTATRPAPSPRRPGRVGLLAGCAVAVLVAAAAGLALAHRPPSTLTLAALVGFGAAVALAVSRYELVIGLGFLLLGVVRFEPAPSDALLTVVIGLALVGGRFDLRRVPGSMLVLVTLLLVLNLLSVADAESLSAAARFLSITLYLLAFAVWLPTWLTTAERMRRVVGAYVAGAVISAGLALLAVVGVPFPGHQELIGESVRAQGLFKDPNVFGPFLIPAVLILLEEAIRPRLLGLRRATAVALLGELVLAITFAYSRAGWLNLAVALVVMLAVMAARVDAGPHLAAVLVIVAALGAVAVAAVVVTGSGKLLSERARVQTYDTQRFDAQRNGIRLAEQHPVGIGPGQFEIEQPVSTHSIYVRVLAEQGLAGLAVLLALLAGTLVLAIRNVVAGRDAHGVGSAALLGAWCGLLANSAFIDTLHWRHLWLVAALIWVAAARRA